MEDEKVGIKTVRVEYITATTDKFDNELSYFKLRDKSIESKYRVISFTLVQIR